MSFSWKKQYIVVHGQCGSADSSAFPVTICHDGTVLASDTDLKDTNNGGAIRPDGFDIYFYSDSALTTRIPAERVWYDGVNGKGEWHAKRDISHSTDTDIWMAFGDASITTDPNSDGTYGMTSVWDSHYKCVLHMGSPSSLSANDSTSNAQNGTAVGVTATTGAIGGGANFDATSGHRILIPDSAAFTVTDFTIECKIKSSSSGTQLITEQLGTQAWGMYTTGGTLHGFATASGNQDDSSGTNVCTGAFVSIFFRRDTTNSTRKFDVDGSNVASPSDTQGGSINPTDYVAIGERYNGGAENFAFNGVIDEFRFSDTFRSDSWVTAQYNNQKASSTFLTVGGKTSASSSISGTLSSTLAAVTGVDTGTVAVTGTESTTLAAVTPSASGVVAVTAVSADTLDATTSSASGTVAVTGTASDTSDAVTSIAAGVVAVAGVAADTLGALTSATSGTVSLSGAAADTLGDAVSTATGAVTLLGAETSQLGNVTIDAQGNVGNVPVEGSLNQTLADASISATGVLPIAAVASITLDATASTAAGTIPINGTTSRSLDNASVNAVGLTDIKASTTATLGDASLVSAGVIPLVGSVSKSLGDVSGFLFPPSNVGVVVVKGSLGSTLAPISVFVPWLFGTELHLEHLTLVSPSLEAMQMSVPSLASLAGTAPKLDDLAVLSSTVEEE